MAHLSLSQSTTDGLLLMLLSSLVVFRLSSSSQPCPGRACVCEEVSQPPGWAALHFHSVGRLCVKERHQLAEQRKKRARCHGSVCRNASVISDPISCIVNLLSCTERSRCRSTSPGPWEGVMSAARSTVGLLDRGWETGTQHTARFSEAR